MKEFKFELVYSTTLERKVSVFFLLFYEGKRRDGKRSEKKRGGRKV